jgi:hypothetical protein
LSLKAHLSSKDDLKSNKVYENSLTQKSHILTS